MGLRRDLRRPMDRPLGGTLGQVRVPLMIAQPGVIEPASTTGAIADLLALIEPVLIAFLGITIMDQTELISGEWYTSLPMDWLPDPAQDQHLAGGILWSSGDIIGLTFFGVLFVQWVRDSMKEARREDRRLDRLEAQQAAQAAAAARRTDTTGG